MPKHQLVLNNNQTVNLDSDVSLHVMKKWKKAGLISSNFLGKLVVLETNPTAFETDDIENAIYLAYLNAKNKNHYDQEAFEKLLPYDIALGGQLLSEMCSGNSKQHKLQESFVKATTKNNNQGGKKHPK